MSRRRNNSYDYNDLCSGFQNLSVNCGVCGSNYNNGYSPKRRVRVYRPPVNPNCEIIDNLGTKPVWYRNLHPTEDRYNEILNLITNDNLKIENLVEVNNNVLENLYEKRKRQKMRQFNGQVDEIWLFHGTSKANVDGICTYNFDWRLFGNNHGHEYGKGISFSPNAMYASHYSDNSYHKVMIVAKVLVANACLGHRGMTYPPRGYDASQKRNGSVIVKYDDNEFYPAYKLYYRIEEEDDSEDDYYDTDNNYYLY